jgi:hypothetical protein
MTWLRADALDIVAELLDRSTAVAEVFNLRARVRRCEL